MARRPYRTPLPWLAGLLLLYLVAPVGLFLARSAAHPGEGFGQPGLWGAFATSAEAASISAALVTFFGTPLAYLLARNHGRLAAVAGALVQLPLALPPLMSGVVLLYVFGPSSWLGQLSAGHFTESVTGIVLAQSFVSSPFLVITARSAFAAQGANLEDVAATAGMGPVQRFVRVAMPLASAGLRAGVLLTWLRAFGEYGATVMMSYYPLSLPVFTYVRFSSIGLPATQAPSLLALGLAAAVVGVSRAPLRRNAHGPRAAELEMPPPAAKIRSLQGAPVIVGFKLALKAGDFRLELEHQARTHRLAILGASGAGKSLTLRALAGLLRGEVTFSGRPMADVPAERRRVGFVPQGPSLLPDRCAWANAMLGKYADRQEASYWFDALQIKGVAAHFPAQLSGGQGQRVALARAFSCHPDLVLMDEPFTGLDAPVRAALVQELRRLQRAATLSSVLVTHDFTEAALLADEVLVISQGRALQAGPVAEVSRQPGSPDVARLLGMRNIVPGISASPRSVRTGNTLVPTSPHGLPAGTPVWWCARPEQVAVGPHERPGALPALAKDIVDLGARSLVTLDLGGGAGLQAELNGNFGEGALHLLTSHLHEDQPVWAVVPPEAVLVWPANSEPERTG